MADDSQGTAEPLPAWDVGSQPLWLIQQMPGVGGGGEVVPRAGWPWGLSCPGSRSREKTLDVAVLPEDANPYSTQLCCTALRSWPGGVVPTQRKHIHDAVFMRKPPSPSAALLIAFLGVGLLFRRL